MIACMVNADGSPFRFVLYGLAVILFRIERLLFRLLIAIPWV